MKGDFSRDTFVAIKNYRRVLMQQGRVQLDADWNEQVSILLHYIETLARDLIGPFGGPEDYLGFQVLSNHQDDADFTISEGRFYVDGILCEYNRRDSSDDDLTYQSQDDYPDPPKLHPDQSPYLVYLDVWERHITSLEDDNIREKALGEADTASRAKTVWQVKVFSLINRGINDCDTLFEDDNWKQLKNEWQSENRGRIKVYIVRPDDSTDPCLTPPDADFHGSENQLYRVEIHKEGVEGDASFKWSRDNGSIVTGCKLEGTKLTVDNPRGFAEEQWVELISDELELRGIPGGFAKITGVEGNCLTLAELEEPDTPEDENWPTEDWATKVRLWDGGRDIVITEDASEVGTTYPLEGGIEVQFKPAADGDGHHYRTGDYWLIPARVANGQSEWPRKDEKPKDRPPHGITHHYAPLALLRYENTSWGPVPCTREF